MPQESLPLTPWQPQQGPVPSYLGLPEELVLSDRDLLPGPQLLRQVILAERFPRALAPQSPQTLFSSTAEILVPQ